MLAPMRGSFPACKILILSQPYHKTCFSRSFMLE